MKEDCLSVSDDLVLKENQVVDKWPPECLGEWGKQLSL